jgi:hypothetical protein
MGVHPNPVGEAIHFVYQSHGFADTDVMDKEPCHIPRNKRFAELAHDVGELAGDSGITICNTPGLQQNFHCLAAHNDSSSRTFHFDNSFSLFFDKNKKGGAKRLSPVLFPDFVPVVSLIKYVPPLVKLF